MAANLPCSGGFKSRTMMVMTTANTPSENIASRSWVLFRFAIFPPPGLAASKGSASFPDHNHLSPGLIGLHDAMGFVDLFEAENPDRFDTEPACRGIRSILL